MPAAPLNESAVENTALSWLADLGYEVRHGEETAPGEPAAERDAYDQVVLVGRLRDAVQRLNPEIPDEARDEAIRKVLHPESPSLEATIKATSPAGDRRCGVVWHTQGSGKPSR